MVDNFAKIREILKFENDGDCYYVQLLRRQSDDPMINGQKDPKYHGNMHSRSIKDYFIKSKEHLDIVKDEIIQLCKMFNVRAYIRLNKRTYKHISLTMLKHIAEQEYSGQSFSSPFHLVSSAAGKACAAGKDKTWIVDLDKEYLDYEEDIKHIICQCAPLKDDIAIKKICYENLNSTTISLYNYETIYANEYMTIIPTKSGKHIICKPFNVKTFTDIWNDFTTENDIGFTNKETQKYEYLKQPDIHHDNPSILYVP